MVVILEADHSRIDEHTWLHYLKIDELEAEQSFLMTRLAKVEQQLKIERDEIKIIREEQKLVHKSIVEKRNRINDLSFQLSGTRTVSIKKELCDMQFVMNIFQFFDHPEDIQVQQLNRRFYGHTNNYGQFKGIVSHWMQKIKLLGYRTRLTDHAILDKCHTEGFYKVEFPASEYLDNLSKEQRQKIQIQSINWDGFNSWNFKLTTGKVSEQLSYANKTDMLCIG